MCFINAAKSDPQPLDSLVLIGEQQEQCQLLRDLLGIGEVLGVGDHVNMQYSFLRNNIVALDKEGWIIDFPPPHSQKIIFGKGGLSWTKTFFFGGGG